MRGKGPQTAGVCDIGDIGDLGTGEGGIWTDTVIFLYPTKICNVLSWLSFLRRMPHKRLQRL